MDYALFWGLGRGLGRLGFFGGWLLLWGLKLRLYWGWGCFRLFWLDFGAALLDLLVVLDYLLFHHPLPLSLFLSLLLSLLLSLFLLLFLFLFLFLLLLLFLFILLFHFGLLLFNLGLLFHYLRRLLALDLPLIHHLAVLPVLLLPLINMNLLNHLNNLLERIHLAHPSHLPLPLPPALTLYHKLPQLLQHIHLPLLPRNPLPVPSLPIPFLRAETDIEYLA